MIKNKWGRGTVLISGRCQINYDNANNFFNQTNLWYYNNIGKHLGTTLMPTTKPFQRLGKAITETPSETGEFFENGNVPAGAGLYLRIDGNGIIRWTLPS